MSHSDDLQTATQGLLSELDQRQNAVLEDIDALSDRLDAVLSEYVKGRSATPTNASILGGLATVEKTLMDVDASEVDDDCES